MSYKKICDICGREIVTSDYREFKIKVSNRSTNSGDWGWYRIDAHDECVRRLFETVKINPSTTSVGSVQEEDT